jgi:predicted transcriptional regulator
MEFIAGEDIKTGDYLIISVDDGMVYRSGPNTVGIVVSVAPKDVKAGDVITLEYPALPGE